MAGRPLRRAKLRKNYGAGRRMTAEDGVPPWAVGMDAEWYEMHYAPKKPQSVEDARKKLIGPKLTKKQQAEMDAEYAGEARHAKRYRNPSPDRALEVLAKEHGYKLVKANPRSKSLAALSKMRAAPKGKSTRLIGIEALGIRLANERRDIDPSQYSFERRGFVGSANDRHPRMKDIAIFERTYPDHTWDELQAFTRAHEKIMALRVRDAMDEAHGKGWQERSHQNPAGWMHDESSRAVRRAIATRSPDDIRRARALQVRNEKARLKERMRLPNPKKNGTCPCGCGGKCGKKNPLIEWGTFRNGGNGKVAGDKNTYAIERVYRSGTLPDGWRVLYDDYYSKISRNASSRHVNASGDIVRDAYPSVQDKTVFASVDDAKSAAELHAARHPVAAKPKKARS